MATITLSKKQADSIRDCTARLNIWVGSVRSGKSFSSLWAFISMCMKAPPGNLVIVGRTNDTIKRNIIDELYNFPGIRCHYYPGKRELHLEGRIIYCIGANDERSESKIRGTTFSGAYVDELTLIPESFFKMLLSRLSRDGAYLIATTNPDNPFHWLKKDFIDRKAELGINVFDFRIEDNPILSSQYVNALKKEYTGIWYKRYIEGQWCLADGTVYDLFDEDIHVIPESRAYAKYYIVGVDYGTTNPCAFVLLGFNDDAPVKIWVEKEYYFDSKKEGYQKTDAEYAAALANFIYDYPVKQLYIDPSAASFKLEVRRALATYGKQGVSLLDADNDVANGICVVAKHLALGHLKICAPCKNLIQEFQSYVWNTKRAQKGVEEPIKAHDHCFGKGTLVTTYNGKKPIETIMPGDFVLTRYGFKEVLKTHAHMDECYEYAILGKKIRCTKDHEFFTYQRGWKEARDLIQSDIYCINGTLWAEQRRLYGEEKDTAVTQIPNVDLNAFILLEQEKMEDITISIEMCGKPNLAQFHPNTIFITKMETRQTMMLAISNWLQLRNISPPAMTYLLNCVADRLHRWHIKERLNGIGLKQEKDGTLSMERIHGSPYPRVSRVFCAERDSNLRNEGMGLSFVRITVRANGAEVITLMMRPETAEDVALNFESIDIQKLSSVGKVVPAKSIGRKKVYDLTIKDQPEYFVEDILVHNCLDALRYAVYSKWGEKTDLKELTNEEREFELWKKQQRMNGPWAPPRPQQGGMKIIRPR